MQGVDKLLYFKLFWSPNLLAPNTCNIYFSLVECCKIVFRLEMLINTLNLLWLLIHSSSSLLQTVSCNAMVLSSYAMVSSCNGLPRDIVEANSLLKLTLEPFQNYSLKITLILQCCMVLLISVQSFCLGTFFLGLTSELSFQIYVRKFE